MQSDNVGMPELLHKADLADGSRRRAFVRVEVDLFECNRVACDSGSSLYSMSCLSTAITDPEKLWL